MKTLAALLCLTAPLPAESHWALRSVSAVLHESPAEIAVLAPPSYSPTLRRLYPHDWDLAHELSLRHYGGADLGDWRGEWNLLGRAAASSEAIRLPAPGAADGRSRALEGWGPQQSDLRISGEVDQLNLRWQGAHASFIAGRQSVNLGVGFFFSPLDIFAPFNPLETYRDFRPGVDALRTGWSPSAYSLLELVAVAGYKSPTRDLLSGELPPPPDALSLDGPDGQGSLLARAQANGEAWSLTLQGGRLREYGHLGGALQLEALASSWLLEGSWNARLSDRPPSLPGQTGRVRSHRWAWNAGFSRQWTSWLSGRMEGGANGDLDLLNDLTHYALNVEGRAALSLQAQATPLWAVSGTLLHRWSPGASEQILVSAERSLSDESALTLSLGAPVLWPNTRAGPDLYAPYTVRMELRTTL